MYQTGGTIKETIESVQKHEYVLPAIQREFVWKPEQIARLFDSLMQGYPVGTFLLWRVDGENSRKYRFYDFVRDYHEKDNPHCPVLPEQHNALTAVLDGQQRLTALNIGLCGSMAVKQKGKWWNNPEAFPTRHLYLDLLSGTTPNDDGDLFLFEFLTADQAAQSADHCWFRVSEVLGMEGGPDMLDWVNTRLPQEQTSRAYRTLDRLHRVVQTEKIVAYFEEKSQELSRVLNIFIRLNSGGTVLSYSDLLLSIAVAQWKGLDAREEIHGLVDELSEVGDCFNFSQDLILKAGLVLADIGNVGFKVENFDAANMAELERRWPEVRRALQLTVRLFASFGYSGQNLRATSVLLPVAYYLMQLDPGDRYLSTAAYSGDRRNIQTWVAKSLLKASGIWGSGLDTLLTHLRETIRTDGAKVFPVSELEAQMAKRGKSLVFEDEEIEDLLDLKYGSAQAFSLLTLMFPFLDMHNHFHVDHIFPKARFRKDSLRNAGISDEQIEDYQEKRDRIANLQLLGGAANIEKQAQLPAEWLRQMHADENARRNYCNQHLLGEVPEQMDEFLEFYETRRSALRFKLLGLLKRSAVTANSENAKA
jgi:uncharacterized protein DUF262